MQKSKKQTIKFVIICAIVVAVLVVAIPLIINQLYYPNSGYLTVWGGDDVLAFYGSALGAIGTILLGIIAWNQNSRLLKLEESTFIKNNASTVLFSNLSITGFERTACNFGEHYEQVVITSETDLSSPANYSSLDLTFTAEILDNYPALIRVSKIQFCDGKAEILLANSIDNNFSRLAISKDKCIFNCTFVMSTAEKEAVVHSLNTTKDPILVEANLEIVTSKYVLSKLRSRAKLYRKTSSPSDQNGLCYCTQEDVPPIYFWFGTDLIDNDSVHIKGKGEPQ